MTRSVIRLGKQIRLNILIFSLSFNMKGMYLVHRLTYNMCVCLHMWCFMSYLNKYFQMIGFTNIVQKF